MSDIIKICLHNILGTIYSISEFVVPVTLVSACILMTAGLIKAVAHLFRVIKSTSILNSHLAVVSRTIRQSEFSHGESSGGHIKVIPDTNRLSAFTIGWLKPEIYLTSGLLENLDPDEIDIVIRHESGHVIRRDPLRLLILESISELTWFIPVVKRYVDRIKLSAELACDSIAIKSGHDNLEIAKTLTRVAGEPFELNSGTAIATSSFKDHLELRIKSLLGGNPFTALRISAGTFVASVSILLLLMLSSSAALASYYDPGEVISRIRSTSSVCTDGHTEADLFSELGIVCPHCGGVDHSQADIPAHH